MSEEHDGNLISFEFKGGPLDGLQLTDKEASSGSFPGTEIVDKPTGSLYRYHAPSSLKHAVYTYRPNDSAR